MSKELLQKVIDKGVEGYLNEFFLDVSNYYTELEDDLSEYDGDGFSDFQAIGEINFSPSEKLVVVTANIAGDLTERSGKKAQYEKAKKILKAYMRYDAGIFVFSDPDGNFRLSLVYGTPDATRLVWSNFHRFTYFVSPGLTNKTFLDRVGTCSLSSLEIIKDAFSVEKVNKEFYIKIAKFFYRLTGNNNYGREMQLPSVGENDNKTYEEFAIRLIGRSIFCWFLKHKKSAKGIPLIAKEALSVAAVQNHSNYYHSILEPLFFRLMNTPIKDRKSVKIPAAERVPFLNGGLFEPHENDFYKLSLINVLKIPDKWFTDFFTVLEQYNFTIDENSTVDADVSVDPEMLGRIFENLLAEVDPLTGETARKATGSYYTPRTIVDYMVEQSLKQYLLTNTSLTEEKAGSLLSYEDNPQGFNQSEKEAVVKALKEIKIIDPACGSGAFPMGILHRMLLALEKVDPKLEIWRKLYLHTYHPVMRKIIEDKLNKGNEHYIRKLTLIQDSIYGVDIQPIAVEIAKLRCFLSLVVDELVFDDEDNRGIEPLPNLEFKFVAANSLLGLPKTASQSAFGVTDTVKRLKELRETYLSSFAADKNQIEKDFRATQQRLFKENVEWAVSDTLVKQLTEWNPFSYESCNWFNPEWMFGIENGFDIVITNPPYLGEKGHKEIFGQIKQGTLKEYYLGKMDLFYFFFHLSLNLGTTNAQIAFITTNYYPTAFGATKLRKDFKERATIRKLINFNELKIFESAQGQHNMLSILSKGRDDNATVKTCITKHKGGATLQTLQNILSWQDDQTNYYQSLQKDFYEGDENYIRLSVDTKSSNDPLQNVLEKVKKQGHVLGNLCNVNNGIFSGADTLNQKKKEKYKIKESEVGDGIFYLNKREVDNLALDGKERQIVKPLFKNSDIYRWFTKNTNDLYILNLRYTDRPNINDFPKIKRHLLRFKSLLSDRPRTGTLESAFGSGYWYVMSTSRKVDMESAKIVVPQRSPRNTFGYNEIPWYAASDVFFITKKDDSIFLKYVLALINSNIFYLWLYHRGKRKGDTLELIGTPLSEIPIKKIAIIDQKPFISMTDKILAITKDEDYPYNPDKQARVKELECQIDQMVYELYGLTPEEIAVVEGNSGS